MAADRTETRAVVLDFDGVVLQSDEIKTWAFGELFADRPEIVEAVIALHERYGGISRYRKFEMIYDELLHEPLTDAQSAALGQEYSRLVLDEVLRCPMVDGAREFLEANPAERPVYVASGSPHDELLFTIDQRGLAPFFTAAYGSPHEKPEVIRAVLDRHQLTPDEVVFVGDAWSDLQAARATGVRFVGIVRNGTPSAFPDIVLQQPDLRGLEAALAAARAPDPHDPADTLAPVSRRNGS
jgi:HAD superfamily hydrolase (TIGR01509 family)